MIIKTERRTGPERRQGDPFAGSARRSRRPTGRAARLHAAAAASLPALLPDRRQPRADPHPGAAADANPDEAGGHRQPLRAARRGAPRLRLRQRPVPDGAVQRLRLLRGSLRLTDSDTGGSLDYADAVAALTQRGRFGISMGLERVALLMAEVGHPERGLRGALVGGTNGKGSVVAMVRSILNAGGLRVGTMPKPHLVSYRERIAIDGRPIAPDEFAAAIARVLPAIDRVASEVGPPTEFEALTAAAIGELAARRVDLAVVEVGMGGRLDATNVLDLGVAAITNVQRDHERYLGRTLTAIGGEKGRLIQPGNPSGDRPPGRGLRPILDRCAELDAALPAALGELGLPRPALVRGAMRGKRVHGVLRALAPLDAGTVFARVDAPG